ncbi:uncharacterized protein LOC131077243 [Cryptomeria japonica]|uniref:uncharacterized protein LOC131077243 n=1 Tax=Cryptomeria japonica TaxID=3369 RepID=UPI0027DA46E4|nr:uncharacterized protein LOC131077243 [Cryptomeria japonica]
MAPNKKTTLQQKIKMKCLVFIEIRKPFPEVRKNLQNVACSWWPECLFSKLEMPFILARTLMAPTSRQSLPRVMKTSKRPRPENTEKIQENLHGGSPKCAQNRQSKTVVHSFFGKVNFLRRFIADFTKKTHHIVDMMKGKTTFRWNPEGKKNSEGIESPIAFMSYRLKSHEPKGIWIAKIQEYDFEIKPTKLVRGKGLCQLIAENDSDKREQDVPKDLPGILFVSKTDECAFVIQGKTEYKAQGCKHRPLGQWSVQQFVGKRKLATLALKRVVIDEPFQQWGIDLIGVINPSSVVHTYVLTVTDYFTEWVDAIPVKHATSEVVCEFPKENIICRFGVPHTIVTGNAAVFSSYKVTQFCFEYGITLAHSSNYFPERNGQLELSNKNLVTIIRTLVEENQRSWHQALYNALWVHRITPKRAIVMSPFQLLYGIERKSGH